MQGIAVGCGQITWITYTEGVAKWQVPEEQVLAEIAQAGYEGAPGSPQPGRTTAETLELYRGHGLRAAPGYLGASFWREDRREEILTQAAELARFMAEAGCGEMYVAAGGFDYQTSSGRTRRELAGHVGPGDGLSDEEYQRFADTLNEAASLTLREGVRCCFHNHVGTVIETGEEIERLLALLDPELVALGPDTGHLAWGGVDPVAFCRAYAPRIKTIHVKDIDPTVLAQGRAEGWDYGTFTSHGIFAELGEGYIDFPTIFADLKAAGFAGWVIAETDVTQKPTALESVTISRNYLRGIGL